MRKKLLVLCLSFAMAVSATACSDSEGGKEEKTTKEASDATFERANSDFYGKVTLADYSDFVVYSSEVNIDDETIQQTIDGLMLGYKEYTKEIDEVTSDCEVDISYVGTIELDGEPYQFPKGSADNQKLNIANSNYISGFADGLIGAKKGEKVTLNLTFPENYGSTQDPDGNDIPLANVPVTFEVTVNSIMEGVIPELTDDYAKENFHQYVGCNNVEELKTYFRDYQIMSNVGQAGAVKDFMDKCEFEANEEHLNADLDKMMETFNTYCEQQSVAKEDFFSQYDVKDEEEFKQKNRESLEERFKLYAIICAICEKEGITLSTETFNERLSQLAAQNNQDVDTLKSQIQSEQNMSAEEYFPVQFLYQDVIKLLVEKADVKDGERPTTTEAATEADTTNGSEE